MPDRAAAPAAAEGAGTFLKGGRVIEHWADDGDGPVLSVEHGLMGPCNRCSPWALMRLLHAELAARPAPAAAPREDACQVCGAPVDVVEALGGGLAFRLCKSHWEIMAFRPAAPREGGEDTNRRLGDAAESLESYARALHRYARHDRGTRREPGVEAVCWRECMRRSCRFGRDMAAALRAAARETARGEVGTSGL
jgi:hypothetical protein